jgi:hypothetical protein
MAIVFVRFEMFLQTNDLQFEMTGQFFFSLSLGNYNYCLKCFVWNNWLLLIEKSPCENRFLINFYIDVEKHQI